MPARVMPPDEPVVFEAVSVSPAPPFVLAARAAAVLDAAGALAPDRAGLSARTRPLGAGGMGGVVAGLDADAGAWVVFERPSAGLWGDLRVHADVRLETSPRPHSLTLHLPLERFRSSGGPDEAVLDLMGDLFGALGCFFGGADTAAMRRRRQDLRTAAAERGDMWLPRWDDPRFLIWDRWVEDVWWVNLYGPAYVQRWGRPPLDRAGVRRRDLPEGGLMVLASEEPPDPLASDSIAGYPHKASFYDALSLSTFIHESLEIPDRGVAVPTLADHAAAGG